MSNGDRKPKDVFAKVCRRVAHAIDDFDMISDGDRIIVGLSGGEDSMLLMHILTHLQRRSPVRFDLLAVTVDMSFATFDVNALTQYCEHLNWPLEIARLDGESILKDKDAETRPCALCSRLRRGQLHAVADRTGFNKIALGHQLDDICVSFLLSLFRGQGLKTMGPHVAADAGTKRLIRPLCYVEKSLVHTAAARFDFPAIKSCPYIEQLEADGDRAAIERLLGDLEPRFHNIRRTMLRSLRDLRPDHLLDTRFHGIEPQDK
jgi:tRNA 2-thiocytidine biosynthesis protein TtcA